LGNNWRCVVGGKGCESVQWRCVVTSEDASSGETWGPIRAALSPPPLQI
jgi:hypothetical protein